MSLRADGTHHENDVSLSILFTFTYSAISTGLISFISLRAMYEVFPEFHFTLCFRHLVEINLFLTPVLVLKYPLSIGISSSVFLCPIISYNILQLYPLPSTWLQRFSAMTFSVYSTIYPSGVSTLYYAILSIGFSFDVPINLPSWYSFLSFTQANTLDYLQSPGS